MDKTLRQVTDSVHGTIYLSKLESELISTPYFYRLHDIYQSSTVYMTFPSNRTKRYEHSLGTMELASSMLFSSVSNADNKTKKLLFQQLGEKFKTVLHSAIFNTQNQSALYFNKISDIINCLFANIGGDVGDDESFVKLLVKKYIMPSIVAGDFSDSAIEQYQYYPMGFENKQNSNNINSFFLYRCLLEAVRIVALFHDVGHPPYSHIIEEVLYKLYDECNSQNNIYDKNKIKKFNDCILPYVTTEENKAYRCNTLISKSSLIDAHLHERIGLSLLQSAILSVVPNMIRNISESSKKEAYKISNILYYIMVVEIALAILVENDNFFKSFHKIVDGVIDSDRLDYIMRDSINSGVDWGQIPYKRLINSAKLVNLSLYKETDSNIFIIAYPKKVSEDIEDLLLMRYKIFARINFHHRCMKTTITLQSAIIDIAKDYLLKKVKQKKDNTYVNSAIQTLWNVLDNKAGERSIRIIQWNDSWLISVLHKALVNINSDLILCNNLLLKENLEEILLNKKKYYSLIKRGLDSKRLVKKIFKFADITKESLIQLKLKEQKKYYTNLSTEVNENNILNNPKSDGLESIIRCTKLLEVINIGDLELLDNILPLPNKSIINVINDILTEQKGMNYIIDYKVIINNGRSKLGLPSHKNVFEEIYLYDKKDTLICFDENETLSQQIKAIEKNVPWIYVYIIPPEDCKDIKTLFDNIENTIATGVGKEIKERFNELFGK